MAERLDEAREKAITLLADGSYTQKQVAEKVGVSARSIREWLTESEFVEAVIARSRRGLRTWLPYLYRGIIKQALQGQGWAARLILEHIEALEEIESRRTTGRVTFGWRSPGTRVSDPVDLDE